MRLTGWLMVSICATALLVAAQEEAEPAVRSKIIALEKAWNQAYKLGDKRALETLLDDQIVLINDDGTVQTKAEFLASVKKAASSQEQQIAPDSMSVRVHGNAAIATGIFRAKGIDGGKRYVRRERFVDTWVYKDGKWVCVATNATPVLR